MTTLQFVDTHNLVAFLTKSAESEGFEQIVKTVNGEQQLQALVDGKKIITTEATVRRDLQLEDADGVDCLPNATKFDLITPHEASQSSVSSDPANIADEAVIEEPSMQLKELMDFYTKLQQRVLDLENTKTAQAQEITSLKKREDASKHGRKIHDIDADEDITLENVYDAEMFDVNDLDGDEVVVESEVADKDVNLSVDEVTLAQELAALKSVKVQEKGDVIKEPSVTVKKMSKKELLKLDEELAFKLQAEEDDETPPNFTTTQRNTTLGCYFVV
ncbi:hypothetical protein Tco_0761460 [Tanacetum coccineum]